MALSFCIGTYSQILQTFPLFNFSPRMKSPSLFTCSLHKSLPLSLIILIISKFFFPFSTTHTGKQGSQYYIHPSRHREIVDCACLSGMMAAYVLATSFKIRTTITTAAYSKTEKVYYGNSCYKSPLHIQHTVIS